MFRSRLATLVLLPSLLTWPTVASADSTLLVLISRIDDYEHPGQQFSLDLMAGIDLPGVSGVQIDIAQGTTSYALRKQYALIDEWTLENDVTFATLDALRAALDGVWVVTTTGAASASRFTLNAASLTEAHFFATPGDLDPAHGAVDVAGDTKVSWTDPTGDETPYVLIVRVETYDPYRIQEANSLALVDPIDAGATSWQPRSALEGGLTELDVFYAADPLPAGLITAITTDTGAIVWANRVEAPPDYPAATPLLALGSESFVEFTVEVPEPASAALQLAALAALASVVRRRRRHAG